MLANSYSCFYTRFFIRQPRPPTSLRHSNKFQAMLPPLAEGQRSANGSPASRYRRRVISAECKIRPT